MLYKKRGIDNMGITDILIIILIALVLVLIILTLFKKDTKMTRKNETRT